MGQASGPDSYAPSNTEQDEYGKNHRKASITIIDATYERSVI